MGPSIWALVKDRYDLLAELGNIFLVRPENLRSLLQEGLLAHVDAKLIRPFLQMRADYRTAEIEEMFPDIGGGGGIGSLSLFD